MNYLVTNNIIICSFLNTLAPYLKKNIIVKIGYLDYNLVNSWVICILHTYSSNNLNLQLHNLQTINFKDIIILIGLAQIQIYTSSKYNSLITKINVSELLFYIRFFESLWNFIFSILLENNYNRNKLFGLIIITSGLVVYNK